MPTPLRNSISNYSLIISFIIALSATIGSLYYSEIVGYEPCKLCWIQRIFMYPLVLIFGLALIKRSEEKFVSLLGIIMSALGFITAGYHTLLQNGLAPSLPCSAEAISCSQRFEILFGISIPAAALFAFLTIFVLCSFKLYVASYISKN